MEKKYSTLLIMLLCALVTTGCSDSKGNAKAESKGENRLSFVTIKEGGNALLTKGGEVVDFSTYALKSGGNSIASGSKTAARKTG